MRASVRETAVETWARSFDCLLDKSACTSYLIKLVDQGEFTIQRVVITLKERWPPTVSSLIKEPVWGVIVFERWIARLGGLRKDEECLMFFVVFFYGGAMAKAILCPRLSCVCHSWTSNLCLNEYGVRLWSRQLINIYYFTDLDEMDLIDPSWNTDLGV